MKQARAKCASGFSAQAGFPLKVPTLAADLSGEVPVPRTLA